MRLKRAYLTRTLQMGQYTLRTLDGGEGGSRGWGLNLHPELGAISVQLGPDELFVPLVHVESFEVAPRQEPSSEEEVAEDVSEELPVRRGPGRPRTKRVPAEL